MQLALLVLILLQLLVRSVEVCGLFRPLCGDGSHAGGVLCVQLGDVVLIDLLGFVHALLRGGDSCIIFLDGFLLGSLLFQQVYILLILFGFQFLLGLLLRHFLDVGNGFALVAGQVFVGEVQAINAAVQLVDEGFHLGLLLGAVAGGACQCVELGGQCKVFDLAVMDGLRIAAETVDQVIVLADYSVDLGYILVHALTVVVQRGGKLVDAVFQGGCLIGRVAVGAAGFVILLFEGFQFFGLRGGGGGHGHGFVVGVLILVAKHGDGGGQSRNSSGSHQQAGGNSRHERFDGGACKDERCGNASDANSHGSKACADRSQGLYHIGMLREEVAHVAVEFGQFSRCVMDGRLQDLRKGDIHLVVGLFPFLGQAFAGRGGAFQRPGRFIQRSRQGVGGDSTVPDSPRKVHADLASKDFHGLCGGFGAVFHVGNFGDGILQGFLCIQPVGGKVLDGGAHGRDGGRALDAVKLHFCQQADGVFER